MANSCAKVLPTGWRQLAFLKGKTKVHFSYTAAVHCESCSCNCPLLQAHLLLLAVLVGAVTAQSLLLEKQEPLLLESDIEVLLVEKDITEKEEYLDASQYYTNKEEDEPDAKGGPRRRRLGIKRAGRPRPTNPLQAIASQVGSFYAPLLRPGGGGGGVLSRDSPSPPWYGAPRKPSHHTKPSFAAPQPSIHPSKQAYRPRKIPSYHQPKPSYHQPDPSYHDPLEPNTTEPWKPMYETTVKNEVDEYGSPQAPVSSSYDGLKDKDKDEYGSKVAPASIYTDPDKKGEQYGSPQVPSTYYSQPEKEEDEYGSPQSLNSAPKPSHKLKPKYEPKHTYLKNKPKYKPKTYYKPATFYKAASSYEEDGKEYVPPQVPAYSKPNAPSYSKPVFDSHGFPANAVYAPAPEPGIPLEPVYALETDKPTPLELKSKTPASVSKAAQESGTIKKLGFRGGVVASAIPDAFIPEVAFASIPDVVDLRTPEHLTREPKAFSVAAAPGKQFQSEQGQVLQTQFLQVLTQEQLTIDLPEAKEMKHQLKEVKLKDSFSNEYSDLVLSFDNSQAFSIPIFPYKDPEFDDNIWKDKETVSGTASATSPSSSAPSMYRKPAKQSSYNSYSSSAILPYSFFLKQTPGPHP